MIWLIEPEIGCGYNSCFMYLRKPTLNLLMGARVTSLLKSEGATSCAMVYELDLPKHSFIQVMCFLKPSINSSVSHGSDEVVYIYMPPPPSFSVSHITHTAVLFIMNSSAQRHVGLRCRSRKDIHARATAALSSLLESSNGQLSSVFERSGDIVDGLTTSSNTCNDCLMQGCAGSACVHKSPQHSDAGCLDQFADVRCINLRRFALLLLSTSHSSVVPQESVTTLPCLVASLFSKKHFPSTYDCARLPASNKTNTDTCNVSLP
jgi:hypothetical protein